MVRVHVGFLVLYAIPRLTEFGLNAAVSQIESVSRAYVTYNGCLPIQSRNHFHPSVDRNRSVDCRKKCLVSNNNLGSASFHFIAFCNLV